MTRRKHIKRIDPRYFLHETAKRMERRYLKEDDEEVAALREADDTHAPLRQAPSQEDLEDRDLHGGDPVTLAPAPEKDAYALAGTGNEADLNLAQKINTLYQSGIIPEPTLKNYETWSQGIDLRRAASREQAADTQPIGGGPGTSVPPPPPPSEPDSYQVEPSPNIRAVDREEWKEKQEEEGLAARLAGLRGKG